MAFFFFFPKEVGVCTCVSPKIIHQMRGKVWA